MFLFFVAIFVLPGGIFITSPLWFRLGRFRVSVPAFSRLVSESTINEVSGVFTDTFKGVSSSPEMLIIKGAFAILNCLILFLTLVVMSTFSSQSYIWSFTISLFVE